MKKAFLLFLLLVPHYAAAQSRSDLESHAIDPRGEPELTICSQNLKLYSGPPEKLKGAADEAYRNKEAALLGRFVEAKCDVIAVQEIQVREPGKAEGALKALATALLRRTGRSFDTRVGDTNDNTLRVGFLVAKDRAEIVNTITYRKVLLPPIDDNQKPRQFSRAPLELQLQVKGKGAAPSKTIGLINMHFKSKSGSQADPAGAQWETARMEMAEGLRRIVEDRYKDSISTGDIPVIVLGDRNAEAERASAKILEGALLLQDFKGKALCRLSKGGSPLCQAGAQKPQLLFSVLNSDPQMKQVPGTYIYKKVYSWLDDILMPASSLGLARVQSDVEGDYDVGVISQFKNASDHALVYVRLNW